MKKIVTVQDVATRAGVSKMLASLALRDRPGVAVETYKRIRRAADELGYKPNKTRGRYATFEGLEYFHIPTEKDIALAKYYCRKWYHKGIDHEELHSEAMVALTRACVTFDPQKLCLFATHLMWCVRSRLRSVFAHDSEMRQKHQVKFIEGDAPVSDDTVSASLFDFIPDPASLPGANDYRFEAEVSELFSLIDEHQAWLLEQHFLEARTVEEIADEVGRDPDFVSEDIECALDAIRQKVL